MWPGEVGAVAFAVRVYADGHGNIVDFGVGEELVAVHFEAVEHFAAQRQDGLGVAVAGEFGRAAGGIAFHQEQLVFADVFAFAVGELAGQHGNAAAFAFFDFFHRAHALLGLFDGELGNFLAGFEVLVEPQFGFDLGIADRACARTARRRRG